MWHKLRMHFFLEVKVNSLYTKTQRLESISCEIKKTQLTHCCLGTLQETTELNHQWFRCNLLPIHHQAIIQINAYWLSNCGKIMIDCDYIHNCVRYTRRVITNKISQNMSAAKNAAPAFTHEPPNICLTCNVSNPGPMQLFDTTSQDVLYDMLVCCHIYHVRTIYPVWITYRLV